VEVGAVAAGVVGGEAFDAVGVEVAVGDDGAVEGDAELAAVGVPGEDEGVAVGGEGVEDAQVGRVDDGQGQVRARFDAAGDQGVAVALYVGVVEAGEGDVDAVVELEAAAGVAEADPAGGVEGVADAFPGVAEDAGGVPVPVLAVEAVLAAAALEEVAGGVAGLGAVVVVGAEDVRAGEFHEGAESVEELGDRLGVGEVVAGVDDEVGAQAGEGLQPAALLVLAADHVDVGDLEYAQRPHAGGEYGDLDPPQAEGPRFDSGGVGHAGRADCRDAKGNSVSRAHAVHGDRRPDRP
jgi:hypothetical protein